jgi:hypothetical protein
VYFGDLVTGHPDHFLVPAVGVDFEDQQVCSGSHDPT